MVRVAERENNTNRLVSKAIDLLRADEMYYFYVRYISVLLRSGSRCVFIVVFYVY